ncbi:unnamed protein product [Lupinus luteus]|uniref:DNA-directed RNA polymerase III subunit n=1 Tax=Lupinus luteus TaxID=3873 RepID=A0AAV1VU95_LUPLU
MAGRGRGRGRGGRGFGGGFTYARQVEFVPFPEDVDLPKVKIDEIGPSMKKLLRWGDKFQNYWKASPYFLEETTLKGDDESQSMHIARYSDKKKTKFTRDSLSQILVFNGFAKELVQGKSGPMRSQKKVRWNPESGLKRLEFFEQQEKKGQGRVDKGEEEKKDEDEDEIGEDGEASDEDEIGDDDYIKGEYYDDNEDDYNDVDDGDGIFTLLIQSISQFTFTLIILRPNSILHFLV